MPEPSLSELYSYRPNPDLAQGDRDVVPDNRAAIQDAIGLAQDNNQAIQQRYALFQKQYADRLKSGQVDYSGINPNHVPALKEKAANLFSILYKNPSALAGINVDPKVEAEFAAAKDDLERSVAQSKQQYDYAKAQDAFMNHTPELITEENKQVAKSNYTDPLGQFQPRALNLPPVIDLPALSKSALDASKKENSIFEQEFLPKRTATGELIPVVENGKVKVDANGQPVYEQEYAGRYKSGVVKEADMDTYMKYGDALFDSNQPTGKYNQPFQESIKSIYNKLPESQKIQIENAAQQSGIDPLKYFFKKTWASRFDKQTDLSGVKEVEDNLYKMAADQRNDLEKMKKKFGYDVYLKDLEIGGQKELEGMREANDRRKADYGGEILNDTVTSTLSKAIYGGAANARMYKKANGEVERDWRGVALSPLLLKSFGTMVPVLKPNGQPVVGSNGKPTMKEVVPVEIWVNRDGTKVRPIFGTEKTDGGREISYSDLSQPMDVDQYKIGLAKGLGLEKSLDASNRMLERMTEIGFPSLNGKIDAYIKNRASGAADFSLGGGSKSEVKKTQSGGGSKMNGKFPEAGAGAAPVEENITIKGTVFPRAKLEAAAKKYKMSYDDYVKSIQ